MPGKVLHLDGDASYLKKCLDVYERIGVPVYGVHCHEKKMPSMIDSLIDQYRPDILVITGHDAYSKQRAVYTISVHIVILVISLKRFKRQEGRFRI